MSTGEIAVAIYRRVPSSMRPYLKGAWCLWKRILRLQQERLMPSSEMGRTLGPKLSSGSRLDPLVTIVVAAFNEQDWLDDCLQSIANQTLGDFECIIIDDASSDYTMDIAGRWATQDSRFRVLRHDRNWGLSASRNSGLSAARGEFITFLDADDFLFPCSLEKRASALANNTDPTVIGVYCDWVAVEEDDTVDTPVRPPPADKSTISFIGQRGECPFIATSPMLRIEKFRRFHGFNEAMHSSEDFEMWMRVMRHGYRFNYVKYVGVSYRQRRSGMVLGSPATHAATAITVLDQLEVDLEPAERVDDTPYRYDLPLSNYDDQLRRVRRLIPPIAFAVWSGNNEQIDAVGAMLPPDAWFYVEQSVNVRKLAQAALNRVMLADPTVTTTRRDHLANEAARTAEQWLRRAAVEPAAASTAPALCALRETGDRAFAVIEPRIVDIADAPEAFGGVVMFPMARYHVEEMVPLVREIESRGLPVSWVVTRHHPEDVRIEMRRHGVSLLFNRPEDWNDLPPFAGAVMFNDWGPTKDLLDVARTRGVPTFAKVEGVQDFDDVDIDHVRKPYRWADFILCQGDNDVRALEGCTTHIVGNSRLQTIAMGPQRSFGLTRKVIVNSNFSYNVLSDKRKRWLDSVLRACELADVEALVSQHPADEALPSGIPMADAPMRYLLSNADVLISRFSTVPFEAMAYGVPFIYHNPHGEKVPTFANPGEAFRIVTSVETLAAAIIEALDWRGSYRERCANFFSEQVDIDPSATPAQRSADVIQAAVENA